LLALILTGACLLALILIYIFLLAPGRIKDDSLFQKTLYAHRGLHNGDNSVPENSLAAFSLAAEQGCGIELDVRLTADDKVVVFHDDSLKRVCGIDKIVSDCTYEELRGYKLYKTEESIPLFTEVLVLVGGRVPIIVEVKNSRKNALLCAKTAEILDAYSDPFVIESFNPFIAGWFKKNRPGVIRGQLAAGFAGYGPLPKYQGALLSLLLLNFVSRPHFAAFRHEDSHHKIKLWLYRLLGGKLVAWTVQNESDMDYCREKFDAVIFENFRPKNSFLC
jgi:glycerophosphoryl diester phosphodiesterase